MLKKSLICTLAITILSLFCTVSFAAEENNKINLGNEIMRSIDKTEKTRNFSFFAWSILPNECMSEGICNFFVIPLDKVFCI